MIINAKCLKLNVTSIIRKAIIMRSIIKFLPLFILCSCHNNDSLDANHKKTDLNKNHLRGTVVEVKQDYYKAEEKNGEIVPGERSGENDENFLSKYDKQGNLIEKNTYYHDGSLFSKTAFTFDDAGNVIVENCSNADGTLSYKKKYNYFDNYKMRADLSYKADVSLYAIDTVEFDEKGNELNHKGYNMNGKRNAIIINKYDKGGNVLEKADDSDGRQFNTIYKHDRKGNIIEEISYFHYLSPPDNHDTIKYSRKIRYDLNDIPVEVLYIDLSGKSQPSKTTFNHVYDKQNNWIKKTIYTDNIPEAVIVRQIKYQ